MKQGVLLLLAFYLIGFSYAQKNLTGPISKNQAIWEKARENSRVFFNAELESVQGLNAKKSKVWDQESPKLRIRTRKEIHNPKGLEAKNWKPWKDYSTKATNSKAAYILPKGMRKKKIWFH